MNAVVEVVVVTVVCVVLVVTVVVVVHTLLRGFASAVKRASYSGQKVAFVSLMNSASGAMKARVDVVVVMIFCAAPAELHARTTPAPSRRGP